MNQNLKLASIVLNPASIKKSIEIAETGIYDTAELPAIDPGNAFRLPLGIANEQIDKQLQTRLALVVERTVSVETVEALIISNWEKAKWVAPGRILFEGSAYLEGPWIISAEIREKYALKGEYIYLLDCPPCRFETPVPTAMLGINPVVDAYSAGEPYGLELAVIQTLFAIATRVEGQLLIPPTANMSQLPKLIKPDPLEKIGLYIYAQAWLNETRLKQMLEYLIQQEKGESIVEIISSEVAAPVKDLTYRVVVQVEENITVVIEVESGEGVNGYLPPVLRFVKDKETAFACYSIHYQESVTASTTIQTTPVRLKPHLSRQQRKKRMIAKTYIEKIVIMLNTILGGNIIDEDGFLLEPSK